MRWTEEERSCNHGIINFRAIRFMINGSRRAPMSQVQSYDGLVAYFHRKDYAIKTNMVGRRTQSNALTSLS